MQILSTLFSTDGSGARQCLQRAPAMLSVLAGAREEARVVGLAGWFQLLVLAV